MRHDCDEDGSFVYIDCMYEAASAGIFERIEEATLTELLMLRDADAVRSLSE